MGQLKDKGGLNSKCLSRLLKSPKNVPNHTSEQYSPKEKLLRVVILAPFFEDLSSRKKLSEIKLPLISMSSLPRGVSLTADLR